MRVSLLIILFLMMLGENTVGQTELLEDFSIQLVTDEIGKPNGLIFDEQNRMLVWERFGVIWIFENGKKLEVPLLDISEEVMSNGDLGLLSIALDEAGYIYLYYIVDYHHLKHFGTQTYNPFKNEINKATIGRVTRFKLDNGIVDLESRQVLIGRTIDSGIPILHTSHVGGSLIVGDDGSILLSIGDCSTWEGNYVGDGPPYYNAKVPQALEDGIIRPEEEVGTMRSQMINSYSGKIIRFDAETGLGLPSNPFYDESAPDEPKSKVWALGFRNPFRMTIRRGSGTSNAEDGLPGNLFVGEVGAASWEELNVITKKGQNFGWPLFEGNGYSDLYVLDQVNRDAINPCDGKPFKFQDLVKQISLSPPEFKNPCDSTKSIPESFTFVHQPPTLNLAHITVGLGVFTYTFDEKGEIRNIRIEEEGSKIEGDVGMIRSNAAIAGSIYTGDKFPEEYKGDLFITDYNNGWICRVDLDLNEEARGIYKLYDDTFRIVHLTENPVDGCLYFIKSNGRIEKICYDVNVPPIIKASADRYFGPTPLEIRFDASESYDPEGANIEFYWDFGDGTTSTDANPVHSYVSSSMETYTARLVVMDEEDAVSEQEFLISINNSPPKASIKGVEDGQLYSISGLNHFDVSGEINDSESNNEVLDIEWSLFLHHNTHFHEEVTFVTHNPRFDIPPVGCGDEIFYYRIKLECTDPQGLVGLDQIFLYPNCDDDFVELLNFQAVPMEEGVRLIWDLADADNLKSIEVERVVNSSTVVSIAEINKGQSSEFLDSKPKTGWNVYRLKLNSIKGGFAYSEQKEVLYGGSDGFILYPNPAKRDFNIHFTDLQGAAQVELFDNKGALVHEEEISGVGATTKKIEGKAGFTEGVYLVQITFNGKKVGKKIIFSQ